MAQCSALTKKKNPCPINADRNRGVAWFCHVHDPEGLFKYQAQAKRTEREPQRVKRIRDWPKKPDPVWLSAKPVKF